MRQFVFDGDSDKLTKYLGRVFPELGRGYLQELLKNKDIKINGARVSYDTPIFCGDIIEVYASERRLNKIKIVSAYQSDDIAVYVKTRGITVEEFANRVQQSLPQAILCHRLDTNTEGLVIFALTAATHSQIKNAFKKGYIHKYYLARVVGNLKNNGVLSAYLVKDERKGLVKIVDETTPGAVRILTGVTPISYNISTDTTLVRVELITGKTHQIRAHLAHIGHPIVGDPKYGDYIYNHKVGASKQMLSAYSLSFTFDKESRLYYLNKQTITAKTDFD